MTRAQRRSLLYFHHAGGLPVVPRGVRAAATAAGFEQVTGVGFEREAAAATWATIEMLAAASIVSARDSLAGAVLYGHSMGGLVAFEVCRQLAARRRPMPSVLVLGATAPPGVLPPTSDTCSRLGVDVAARGAGARVRTGIVRARAYAPSPARLDIAVHAVCGLDDEIIPPDVMLKWTEFGCESLSVHSISGDHLFHQRAHEQFSQLFIAIAGLE